MIFLGRSVGSSPVFRIQKQGQRGRLFERLRRTLLRSSGRFSRGMLGRTYRNPKRTTGGRRSTSSPTRSPQGEEIRSNLSAVLVDVLESLRAGSSNYSALGEDSCANWPPVSVGLLSRRGRVLTSQKLPSSFFSKTVPSMRRFDEASSVLSCKYHNSKTRKKTTHEAQVC